jgi:glycosyltransferase involved in cell wall biosynthesis
VIPAFNPQPGELERAVASVEAQTFGDWDCVVVDDGSAEPIRLEGIRVVRQDNSGPAEARNAGARIVSADLLAFLDADDIWLPEKLERQVEYLERNRLDACDTNCEIVRDGEVIARGYRAHDGQLSRLLHDAAILVNTLLVTRAAFDSVGGFDSRYRFAEDWVFALALTRAGFRLGRLEEVLTVYHLHDRNASSDYRAVYEAEMAIFREYAPVDPDAVRRGRRFRREVTAYKAIDAYRETRDPRHLVWAARRNPRVLARAVAKSLLHR